MKPVTKSFLQRGRWARPALTLAMPESPRLRQLMRRRWSLLCQIEKLDQQIARLLHQ